jgi:AGZA family xanthine/uracil permease-like MFS transporter
MSELRVLLDRRFGLTEQKTDVRTEAIAGATTFLTMVYIAFVNPAILSETGMDQGAVFVATCIAAMIGTLIMGLYANYPIALAPGMGLNAYFAYTVVLTLGYPWETALGAVFISGVLFIALSLLRVRQYVINSVPRNLKLAISAGIGLFLGTVGLQNAGIVVAHPTTLVSLGDMSRLEPALAILGFALIVGLARRKIPGAVLVGILAVTIVGLPLGLTDFRGIISAPPDPTPTLVALDLAATLEVGFVAVVFTFFFVDLFDTAGTLIGVAHRANLLDEAGRLPRLNRALLADSSATVAGSLLGTSTVTSYIESAAGTNAGGRTGLTAVFVAGLFGCTLFFAPLAAMVPAYATASALLYVAVLMARGIAEIDWDDVTEYAPAVVTAIVMPLTFSIATGIGFGFISYTLIKLLSGRPREIGPAVLVISLLFVVKFSTV